MIMVMLMIVVVVKQEEDGGGVDSTSPQNETVSTFNTHSSASSHLADLEDTPLDKVSKCPKLRLRAPKTQGRGT